MSMIVKPTANEGDCMNTPGINGDHGPTGRSDRPTLPKSLLVSGPQLHRTGEAKPETARPTTRVSDRNIPVDDPLQLCLTRVSWNPGAYPSPLIIPCASRAGCHIFFFDIPFWSHNGVILSSCGYSFYQ